MIHKFKYKNSNHSALTSNNIIQLKICYSEAINSNKQIFTRLTLKKYRYYLQRFGDVRSIVLPNRSNSDFPLETQAQEKSEK